MITARFAQDTEITERSLLFLFAERAKRNKPKPFWQGANGIIKPNMEDRAKRGQSRFSLPLLGLPLERKMISRDKTGMDSFIH